MNNLKEYSKKRYEENGSKETNINTRNMKPQVPVNPLNVNRLNKTTKRLWLSFSLLNIGSRNDYIML